MHSKSKKRYVSFLKASSAKIQERKEETQVKSQRMIQKADAFRVKHTVNRTSKFCRYTLKEER